MPSQFLSWENSIFSLIIWKFWFKIMNEERPFVWEFWIENMDGEGLFSEIIVQKYGRGVTFFTFEQLT